MHSVQAGHRLYPVTALSFLRLGSRLLLLCGEGPYVNIYDIHTWQREGSSRISDTENIHGIKIHSTELFADPKRAHQDFLVWAGASICLASIETSDGTGGPATVTIKILAKAQADDWIQDVCFSPAFGEDISIIDVVFLTSHNVLCGFCKTRTSAVHEVGEAAICLIATGPPSLLYCAHILWPASGRGLVAAGTVFGNVIIWSFPTVQTLLSSSLSVSHCLHYTLEGHEGSIFGVRIFESSLIAGNPSTRCFVASCSDDRTIRVWDVTGWDDVKQELYVNNSSKRRGEQVITAMSHKSRIWGIRFLGPNHDSVRILSYGEDCSTQTSRIHVPINNSPSSPTGLEMSLYYDSTYVYHTGKNIWAADVFDTNRRDSTVASGGADGRIVCYTVDTNKDFVSGMLFSHKYSMEVVRAQVPANARPPDSDGQDLSLAFTPLSKAKAIFAGLIGDWVLVRSLKSALPAYPTGTFNGVATFRERNPTDPAFDSEYLYIEEGSFTTEQGMTLSATRRYVYRFSQDSNQISAWFVKPENNLVVDYLFHILDFQTIVPTMDKISVKAHHLCHEDNYWVDYNFALHAFSLKGLSIRYVVKGPNKDYIADGTYRRDAKSRMAADQTPSQSIGNGVTVKGGSTSIPVSLIDPNTSDDSFRSYVWIDNESFLVATDHGWLLQGSFHTNRSVSMDERVGKIDETDLQWTAIIHEPNIGSSCMMTRVNNHGLILITSRDGTIYYFRDATKIFLPLTKLPRKVACLSASSLGSDDRILHQEVSQLRLAAFASCLGSSAAYHLDIGYKDQNFICNQVQLKLPTKFIATSSLFIQSHMKLVLGFRNGALAVYDLSDNDCPLSPTLVTANVHSVETVTTIVLVPFQNTGSTPESIYILTAGRDGKYAVHLLTTCPNKQSTRLILQTVHTSSLPLGPNIEGATFDRQSQELYLWGFRSMEFVVWNDSLRKEVMSLECGGAHRNWAYLPLENTQGGGNFVWTKASSLNVYSQRKASHVVLQHGGHGREIKAISLSTSIEGYDCPAAQYLATGAEDTTIRIFRLISENHPYPDDSNRVAVLSKHTTGIQQLRWSANGRLLFSAAGREELFVCQVQPVPFFGIGVICLTECPPVTEAGDLRVMGIDIVSVVPRKDSAIAKYILAAAYSDSTLRIFYYDSVNSESPFQLASVGRYTGHCLTEIYFVRIQSHLYCCTASTDGYVAVWPLDTEQGMQDNDENMEACSEYYTSSGLVRVKDNLSFVKRVSVHQSSINCMATLKLSDADILIATVGDDGAVAFSRITGISIPENEHRNQSTGPGGDSSEQSHFERSTLLIPKAHASAIDALTYLGNEGETPHREMSHPFVTCGKDQRLKWWKVTVNLEQPGIQGFTVVKERDSYTPIADVSSLECVLAGDQSSPSVVVAGIGMEIRGIAEH